MRILHVVPTYLPAVRYGGPIFAVHALCRALVTRGHTVEVVTTNIDGPKQSAVPVGVPLMLDDVKVRYFSSTFLRRLSWSPSLAQALKGEIAEFDLVHLHSVFLWPTWAAGRLALKAHVPYVISPRGMLVKELVQRRSRVTKAVWIKLIEKSNMEQASAIHVTSALERAELTRFKWQLPRVVEIPNGVDEPDKVDGTELSADVKEIALRQPLVLFLGRISWKKGLDRLLKAFALGNSGQLAIVGTDDEKLVAQLRRLSERLQIAPRVRFLARTVGGPDKEHLFEAARVFVLSSYSENFGNTVVEAMRRGLPVVVTPEVGAAEIVRVAGGGLIVEGEPESLSKAISRLLGDPALARTMGEAGRDYVLNHYAWPRIAAQMEAFYKSVTMK
jgi:glycosyltransferase involved in cell wall biosynthesis